MNQRYQQVRDEIIKTVCLFKRRYGGNVAEMQSAANEYFVQACLDHDPRKTPFKQYVRWKVWYGLLKEWERNKDFRNCCQLWDQDLHARPQFSLRALLVEVSQDAAAVIRLVIEPPLEVIILAKKRGWPKDLREALVTYLSGHGWDQSRIENSFREIGEAL